MPMQLLAPDLAVIDHPLKVGGLALGTRTTVVRRADGGVLLISPGPLDDGDAAEVAAFGPVRAVVAPNLMHHLFLPAALARFPEARLYAPAGLAKKQPRLAIAGPPAAVAEAADAADAAGATLRAIDVGGMPKLQETLFVHLPSRTLVATDLVFNVRAPAPFFTRTFMRFNGGFDRFGPTRICRSLIKDRGRPRRRRARPRRGLRPRHRRPRAGPAGRRPRGPARRLCLAPRRGPRRRRPTRRHQSHRPRIALLPLIPSNRPP